MNDKPVMEGLFGFLVQHVSVTPSTDLEWVAVRGANLVGLLLECLEKQPYTLYALLSPDLEGSSRFVSHTNCIRMGYTIGI